MGFLFLAISLLLVMDLCRFIQFILLRSSPFFPSVRTGFFISIVLSLFLCSYGYVEASWITTEKLLFSSPKIMEEETAFRIIQISDVHLGLLVNRKKLKGIVELINNNKPDLFHRRSGRWSGRRDGWFFNHTCIYRSAFW